MGGQLWVLQLDDVFMNDQQKVSCLWITPFSCQKGSVLWDHGNFDPIKVVVVIAMSVLVCASASYTGLISWENGFVLWGNLAVFLCFIVIPP